ncbi:MAG: adenylate kinase [Actinomycetota bacterium]
MRILMIGAPGAGKGTQAARLAANFSLTHVSSGDILRGHVREQSAVGRKVDGYLNSGTLVPDEILLDLLRDPLLEAGRAAGYVLDGFPRNLKQARAAHEMAEPLGVDVQAAVYLDVEREELVKRMLARAEREHRSDDRVEVIEQRLALFDEHTRPLIDYYAALKRVVTVDGARDEDDVTRSLVLELEKLTLD